MTFAVDVGHSTTITFQSGFYACVTNVEWSGISRESHDTSCNSTTGAKTFIPGALYDPGELQVEGYFDAEESPVTPMTAAPETVTVTFPLQTGQATAANWAASGFMTEYSFSDPMDGIIEFSSTIKLSGAITVTAAVAS